MKVVLFIALSTMLFNFPVSGQSIHSDLFQNQLIEALRTNYSPTSVYSYDRARDTLYATVDRISGQITCVYTGLTISYNRSEGDPSTVAFTKGINAEHTWPQSFYNSASPMVSDLHQLFPSWDIANSTRNNHPFAEIEDSETQTWLYNGTRISSIPTSNIDLYSEYANSTFEPREDHKGNVARAMFYFWTMYSTQEAIVNDESNNEEWFNSMKSMLYEWHKLDPVDQREKDRSALVAQFQGKENPFVLDSSLIYRAYFYQAPTQPTTTGDAVARQIIISQVYEGTSNNKWVEITNTGLTDYRFADTPLFLHLFSNPSGSLQGVSPSVTFELSGTLRSKEVLLLKNSNAVLPSYAEGTVSGVVTFNGNDPLILSTREGQDAWEYRTDVFGLSDGSNFAINSNFTRKSNVVGGQSLWQIDEWETVSNSTVDNASSSDANYLGTHLSFDPLVITGTAGWRLLSFPTTSGTLAQILSPIWTQGASGSDAPDGPPSIFSYSPASNSFLAVTNLNQGPIQGTGYVVYIYPDDDKDGQHDDFPKLLPVESTLEPNSTISLPIDKTNSGWNIVGNPFKRDIYWNSGTWTKTNLDPAIHIWDASINAYKSWNGVVGTNGFTNGKIDTFSAFWVRTTQENADLRVPSTAVNPPSSKSILPETIQFFFQEKEIILLFSEDGDLSLDPLDAELPSSFTSETPFAFMLNAAPFSIVHLPSLLDEPLFIPLSGVSLDQINDLHIEHETDFNVSIETSSSTTALGVKITPSLITSNEGHETPLGFTLNQNYPNPFNPTTNIAYSLPNESYVRLEVFNIQGQQVALLADQQQTRGNYTVSFDAQHLSSGIYFYRLSTNFGTLTRLMTLLK